MHNKSRINEKDKELRTEKRRRDEMKMGGGGGGEGSENKTGSTAGQRTNKEKENRGIKLWIQEKMSKEGRGEKPRTDEQRSRRKRRRGRKDRGIRRERGGL